MYINLQNLKNINILFAKNPISETTINYIQMIS